MILASNNGVSSGIEVPNYRAQHGGYCCAQGLASVDAIVVLIVVGNVRVGVRARVRVRDRDRDRVWSRFIRRFTSYVFLGHGREESLVSHITAYFFTSQ